MDVSLEPGGYVLAVSGGVDSMALLDILRRQPGLKLVVAHFDHGIRPDSLQDRLLVQSVAQRHGLPFVYDSGRLGPGASEAAARQARYAFLQRVRQASGARAIITAHHQDDALETAILNLLRGTGRKGLSALQDRPGLRRPLLHVPKSELVAYAKDQALQWREDSSNQDETYLRNYIRARLLPRFDAGQRQQLWQLVTKARELNRQIDHQLINHLHLQPTAGRLDRHWFIMLPHAVARETMAAWLRSQGCAAFDSRTLERLVTGAKVSRPGSWIDALSGLKLEVGSDFLALKGLER